jgi:hypothetical protein
VNLAVANALVAGVTKRAIGVEVLKGVTAEQQFVKLVYDELVELMGGEGSSALAGGDRGKRACGSLWCSIWCFFFPLHFSQMCDPVQARRASRK